MKKIKFFLYFSLALSLFGSCFDFALASPIGITITPLKYKIEAEQGQVIEDVITVSNPNDFNLRVQAEFQDFKVTEGNSIQWLPGDIENPYAMRDWIKIRQDVITLKPNEEMRVPFKIYVPWRATAGGHYAAIFFRGIQEGEGMLGAVPRVGALIILNVKGDLKKSGQLSNLTGPAFVNSGPVKFTVTFLNTGTTHYETRADLTVKNFFWKTGNFSSETKFVYPNIKRDLPAVWNQKALFGIYTVSAKVADGEGNVYEKSKVFIGFPWKYLLGIVAIVAVLVYLLRGFKKKFKLVRV